MLFFSSAFSFFFFSGNIKADYEHYAVKMSVVTCPCSYDIVLTNHDIVVQIESQLIAVNE